MSKSKTPVKNRAGDLLFCADSGEAAQMVARRQAIYSNDRRCLVLMSPSRAHEHPGRTRTSRGGVLAAIGRSQQYTTATRGRVDGFKTIFAEDLSIFLSAVLDCRVSSAPRAFTLHGKCDVGALDAFVQAQGGVLFVATMAPVGVG